MITPIRNYSEKSNLTFQSKSAKSKDEEFKYDTLLKNTLSTRARIGMDKLVKAFTIYPAKGLTGSKNSNFYEFLAMGNVPYYIGSIMMMTIFNAATKHYQHFAQSQAAKIGNKMALGVLFYAIFKKASKSFINLPVKWITGIDTERPYAKVNYLLRERTDDSENLTSTEYHKVGESVDFPQWDILYGDPNQNQERNFRYDRIAKKNGLGKNLNDSDQDVKPIYKETLVKSKIAKSFSTFLWAATGVTLAFQKPWEAFFKVATLKFWEPENFLQSLQQFGKSFGKSAVKLYKDTPAGKVLLGVSALSTVLGIINTVNMSKKPSNVTGDKVLDKNKESVVC